MGVQLCFMDEMFNSFCATNTFDRHISYHGGPKVEHFVVMAMCVEELMD
jgi:hypothetical protein